jgi:hypothetical protein
MRADGVSFLPVGDNWVALALACVGKLSNEALKSFKSKLKFTFQQVFFLLLLLLLLFLLLFNYFLNLYYY